MPFEITVISFLEGWLTQSAQETRFRRSPFRRANYRGPLFPIDSKQQRHRVACIGVPHRRQSPVRRWPLSGSHLNGFGRMRGERWSKVRPMWSIGCRVKVLQNSSHRPSQFGREREPCLEASELYCTRQRHANTRVAKGRIAVDGAARYPPCSLQATLRIRSIPIFAQRVSPPRSETLSQPARVCRNGRERVSLRPDRAGSLIAADQKLNDICRSMLRLAAGEEKKPPARALDLPNSWESSTPTG